MRNVRAYTFWFLPFYISTYTTLNELLAVFFIYDSLKYASLNINRNHNPKPNPKSLPSP